MSLLILLIYNYFLLSDDSVKLPDYVTVKIHFKDITCLKYRRDVFLTWDSMFGNKVFHYNN